MSIGICGLFGTSRRSIRTKPGLVAQRAQKLLAERTKRLEQETEIAQSYRERSEQLRYGCTLDSLTHSI